MSPRFEAPAWPGGNFTRSRSILWSKDCWRSPAVLLSCSLRSAAHTGWAAPAANHTIVLQQGLNGYTGVRDTWVSDLDWDTPLQYTVNYGTNESLMLDRDGGNNPLLRFDVTGIPANSEIVSATLSLYNNTPSCYGGCTDPYVRRVKLYAVLQDWDEGNQVNSPIDEAGKHGATGELRLRLLRRRGHGCGLACARHGGRHRLRRR